MVKVPPRPTSSREKVTTQEGLQGVLEPELSEEVWGKDAIWQQMGVEELHMC